MLGAARAHVAGCASCCAALARFGRAIASGDPDEIPCIEARLGLAAGVSSPRMARHLDVCPACAAEAAAWQHILAEQAAGALAEPPHYPVFDLSFLPQQGVIWETVRRGVQRLAYEIPAALALAGKALLSPPPGLAISYAATTDRRRDGPAAPGEGIVALCVNDAASGVRLSLHVARAENGVWLAVGMSASPGGQAPGGERVALCNDRGQAQEIKTLRPGETEARFADLAPGRYLVRVQRSGRTWELPLAI
jgi:hypothetical protein